MLTFSSLSGGMSGFNTLFSGQQWKEKNKPIMGFNLLPSQGFNGGFLDFYNWVHWLYYLNDYNKSNVVFENAKLC